MSEGRGLCPVSPPAVKPGAGIDSEAEMQGNTSAAVAGARGNNPRPAYRTPVAIVADGTVSVAGVTVEAAVAAVSGLAVAAVMPVVVTAMLGLAVMAVGLAVNRRRR